MRKISLSRLKLLRQICGGRTAHRRPSLEPQALRVIRPQGEHPGPRTPDPRVR
jgi:hypothetical protein